MSFPDVPSSAASGLRAVQDPALTLPEAVAQAADAPSGLPSALAAHAARVSELLPGLRLHADDQTDPVDGAALGQCPPGLHLVLLLEGGIDVSYGQRRVQLATGTAGAAVRSPRAGGSPRCVWVNLREPEVFSRRVRRGAYARRLSLCVSHDWLRALPGRGGGRLPAPLDALLSCHLALHSWQPSARAVALGEQLVRPPAVPPLLGQLYQQSRLLDLLAEALAPLQAGEPVPEPPAASPGLARRLRDLREFLNSEAADGLTMAQIAREVGMHANTLQAHFRRAYGTTVFGFLRDSRLQRARTALERDGISIKRAAALAGYGSAANFATAFGRHFGITPGQARRAAQR